MVRAASSVIADFESALARVGGWLRSNLALLADWHFLSWVLIPSGGQISSTAAPA